MKHLLLWICLLPIVAAAEPAVYQIDADDAPHVFVTIGEESQNSAGIGIFQRTTGKPYLTLRDNDGDGVFDLLTYSVLNSEGERIMEVEDYGMNGQADFKVNYQSGRASVFYEGQWRETSGPKQDRYVVVDGTSIPLTEVLSEIGRPDF